MPPDTRETPIGLSFSVLGSGSSGNSTLVETAEATVLVDAGLSARELRKRLACLNRSVGQVHAVLVSHEHEDHVRGLEVLSRQCRLVVMATAGTMRSLRRKLAPETEIVELRAGRETRIGDLEILPFSLPHDAREPVGFRLRSGQSHLGHLTDFGMVSDAVREHLSGLTSLIMESNHDVDMVKDGPYPRSLKRRILSPLGHLSNEGLGEFLATADTSRLELLYLAHLSHANNRPELAIASASLALAAQGAAVEIKAASAYVPSPLESAGPARPRGPRRLAANPPARTIARSLAKPVQLRLTFG